MEKVIFYHSSCNILAHSVGTTYVQNLMGFKYFMKNMISNYT